MMSASKVNRLKAWIRLQLLFPLLLPAARRDRSSGRGAGAFVPKLLNAASNPTVESGSKGDRRTSMSRKSVARGRAQTFEGYQSCFSPVFRVDARRPIRNAFLQESIFSPDFSDCALPFVSILAAPLNQIGDRIGTDRRDRQFRIEVARFDAARVGPNPVTQRLATIMRFVRLQALP